MGERFYLRTMSDVGPLWYAGADGFGDLWTPERKAAEHDTDREHVRGSRDALCDEMGIPRSAVRVVRVGPPRRYTLTEKGRAATEPARQRVDGTSDGSKAVPSPSARPEGAYAEPDPDEFLPGDVWEWTDPVEAREWGQTAGERVTVTRRTSTHCVAVRIGADEAEWDAEATRGLRLVGRAGKPWPPVAEPAPAVPERVPVTGTWCADSPVHEHAWQWRDGGLVCAHCGGRRVEAKA